MPLPDKGMSGVAVAEMLGVTPGAVSQWKKRYQRAGLAALKAKPNLGPKPKLTDRQREQLGRLLLQGARRHGYRTELWTLKRIGELIEKRFGVTYEESAVWRVLRGMGWSCQKPERRARERNDEAIGRWPKRDWPRIKKARRSGRTVVLLGETGFMLQPVVRRTWAPKGQTPVHYSWDRRDRLSVISAITVSPERRRLGLYFDVHDHNIDTDTFESVVRWLRRQVRRGIILVLDRWSYTKYADLANYVPDDAGALTNEVVASLDRISTDQQLLRSFFHHAELGL
jgi:transposase